MGFSGLFILGRSDQSLADVPCVQAVGAPCAERRCGDGWRVGQIHYSHDVYTPGPLARGLVDATGAPAVAMYVVHSDFAEVVCDSPLRATHTFLLNAEAALASFEPWDDPPPPPPTAADTVRILQRWSAEAGLQATAPRLVEALEQSPGPFGDGVDALFTALGIPNTRTCA